MQKRFNTLLAPENRGGNLRPVSGASVTVTDPNGALATIYSDNGVTVVANPLTSNATGDYEYYAADGRYTETIVKAGRDTVTISDILLEDPADSPAPTSADMASTAANKGAGLVGFSALVEYAAGTVGRKLKDWISVKDFGAVGDGVADDTAAIRAALERIKEIGGGTLYFPAGTFVISMAQSAHAHACIVVPANVRLKGAGKYVTTITRPAAERSTNGVLFVNEDYDTVTNYLAAGNIEITRLGFTDGETTPNRGLGDLIGFGNGDGLLVHNCYFGNHDQHAVDVCKSRNVKIFNNVSRNEVDQSSSATYQVDGGLIDGIFGSTLGSEKVSIYENDILDSRASNVIHFHTGCYAKDVFVYNNRINGVNIPAGGNAIGGDSDCSYDNVRIYGNAITLNNAANRGINFPSNDTVQLVDNLRIYENEVSGVFRVGVFAGDDSPSLTHTSGPLRSVKVYGNKIKPDLSAAAINSNFRGVGVSAFTHAEVYENEIDLTSGTATQAYRVSGIEDRNCQNIVIRDNRLIKDLAEPASTELYGIYSTFDLHYTNGLTTHKEVRDNHVDWYGTDYHIFFEYPGSMASYNKLKGVISGNRMLQEPITAHIREIAPLSDGTNNLGYVDFTGQPNVVAGDPTILNVQSNTTYNNIPWVGKKVADGSNQRSSRYTLEMTFCPASAGGFGVDTETVSTVWTSATTCAGIIFKDIDLPAGTFDIVTGVSGVSMVINDATHQPVTRTSGYIKILAGI